MSDFDGRPDPPDIAGVRSALEGHAARVRAWAQGQIEEVERRRDEELRRAEGALACVEDGDRRRAPRPARGRSSRQAARSPRSRRSPVSTTPAAVRERCEAVARLLAEAGRPLSHGEIRRTLNLTPHPVTTALKILSDEGRAGRVGTGAGTKYVAKEGASGGESVGSGGPGSPEVTVQGRIMEVLEERGWASADELAQVVGVSREQIVKECGVLLRQEEIRMERRDGRPVYVCRAFS